jgi:predicted nuclease of predicted toxin-antitoxin system
LARVRYYLDEHVDLDIARALRRRGVDVFTAQEAEQRATADVVLLRTAAADGRVFVTQDAGLLRLSGEGESHAGIVYAPHGTPIGEFIRGLT